jgi:hypothetical protein
MGGGLADLNTPPPASHLRKALKEDLNNGLPICISDANR